MGNYDDPELTGRPRRRRWPLALALLALLAGGGAGYALGVATSGTEPAPAPPVAAPAGPATPPAPTAPAGPCLAAGRTGAAVIEQIEQGVAAIGDLDPGALRAVLDRLQPLQADLERAVADCSGRVTG